MIKIKNNLLSLVLLPVIFLSGCDDSKVETESPELVVEQSPIVKWVTKNIDIDKLNESHSVTIPYNIVDPDSTEFTVKAEVIDYPDLVVTINNEDKTATFIVPSTNGGHSAELSISVTDETGLSGSDKTQFTITESYNEAPVTQVIFEQDSFIESKEDNVLVLYRLNANDPDGEREDLSIEHFFYNDNPLTCLPVCQPIPFSLLEYKGRFAATLSPDSLESKEKFWLFSKVSDNYDTTETVSSFWVEERINTTPKINITLEQSVVHDSEPVLVPYELIVSDLDDDVESLSVTQKLYADDPSSCRPLCNPLDIQLLQHENRHVTVFSPELLSLNTPFWLNVTASDGVNTTESNAYFVVTKSAEIAPAIEIILEQETINENNGLVMPYYLDISDPDTHHSKLVVVQDIYSDNPETCRPICVPLAATWVNYNKRYAVTINDDIDSNTQLWLNVEVNDGSHLTQKSVSFDALSQTNSAPVVVVSYEADEVIEDEDRNVVIAYDLRISDSDDDVSGLSVTQEIYRDNPAFCRPICTPINASWSNHSTRQVVTFTSDLEDSGNEFWLLVTASDGINSIDEISSFSVIKGSRVPPEVSITLENSDLLEEDGLTLSYELLINDEDTNTESLVVEQNIYTDNPLTCRPICQPVSVAFTNFEDRYSAELSVDLTDSITYFWLMVEASDGTSKVNDISTFSITKTTDSSPTVTVILDKTELLEEDGLEIEYVLDVQDADTDFESLVITQDVYKENPLTCRPSCQPITVSWSNFNSKYVGVLSTVLTDHMTEFWLLVNVEDGIHSIDTIETFTFAKSELYAPVITVALESDTIYEENGLNLVYNMSITDGDTPQESLVVTQEIYLDNPLTCRPVCQPISGTWSNYNERHAVEFVVVLEDSVTDLWLLVNASDGEHSVDDISGFTVHKASPASPMINVTLENSEIYDNDLTLKYDLIISDEDTDVSSLTLEQNIYMDNPSICRPECLPIDVTWSNHDSRYIASINTVLVADTSFWLEIVVSDGENESTEIVAFDGLMSEPKNLAPSVTIYLYDTEVTHGAAMEVNYSIVMTDPEDDSLTVTGYILDVSDGSSVESVFTNSHPTYKNEFSYDFAGSSKDLVLRVEVSDGTNTSYAATGFTINKTP